MASAPSGVAPKVASACSVRCVSSTAQASKMRANKTLQVMSSSGLAPSYRTQKT